MWDTFVCLLLDPHAPEHFFTLLSTLSLPPPPPLLHLFPPHPIPEVSQYQGQCNPATCNLQIKPFNLSRLSTKKDVRTRAGKISARCATSSTVALGAEGRGEKGKTTEHAFFLAGLIQRSAH